MLYTNRFIELNWQDLTASSRSSWAKSGKSGDRKLSDYLFLGGSLGLQNDFYC